MDVVISVKRESLQMDCCQHEVIIFYIIKFKHLNKEDVPRG